ncbi:mannosyl-3-phosphoglycerate synthase [Chaetomidium leptoderma]|uniref:Mannosyl-3-phosphoglycerate synthase n=1 Tax=Chaetomidium leptoderma TaxID=669021 RepID=A0AAN6VFT9_9PEZI|nr:mannosyl-3-phosphoglycerate synthase [Chaetomidium leptoderma]
MRLTRPSRGQTFGLLHMTEEVQVVELDAVHGHTRGGKQEREDVGQGGEADGGGDTVCLSSERLDDVLSETVIVVPCKDEELVVIQGVVSAIPTRCLVILVSNCERAENDQYMQQVAMAKTFRGYNNRQILVVHQKDPMAASAFQSSGFPQLINPAEGTIRNGKGEGMLLGIALASAFCPGRRYIGFVDADNFNATSVYEYCKAFAAGFAMSSPEEEDTMVRLRWSSKPKLHDGRLDFVSEGRCSKIVNSWLNKLISPAAKKWTGTDNPLVTTGNAGEHALTMSLALKLRMAAGYAIEPFHFIDLLERGHLLPVDSGAICHGTSGAGNSPQLLERPVRVVQIRTISAHFHRASDDEHIRHMWASGLGSVYHGLTPYDTMPGSLDGDIQKLRQDMHDFAAAHGGLDDTTGELPRPKIYPALENIDMHKFRELLEPSVGIGSLRAIGFVQISRL